MQDTPKNEKGARPYFIPEAVDFDSLPRATQIAFQAIVEPTYKELVLGASGALERSAGVTLCFLLCLEILDQFQIAMAVDYAGQTDRTTAADRDQQMVRYLRLVGSKQRAENFLLRIRMFRASREPDPLESPSA